MLIRETKSIPISGTITVGGRLPFVLFAGPCVIESEESCLRHAQRIKAVTQKLGIPAVFKASFDKANRSSVNSFRGPGLEEGIRILSRVKQEFEMPVISDIHEPNQAQKAAEVLDIIQIPAFLSRQTDLIIAAAKTKKPVNIKKGQFLSPWEMKNIVTKMESAGNDKILLTERGFTFGYNNLVVDMRSLAVMRNFGYPVVFDATHSVMLPGGGGDKSSGQREFAMPLMRAACAVGIDALFLEVHENPPEAKSDSANSLPLDELENVLHSMREIDSFIKKL